MKPLYDSALSDIIEGLYAWRIWTRLGWQEVRRRYRRTVFGPFWATFSLGIFIGAIAFVWAPLFKADITTYLPFVATGMIAWSLITALILEGTAVFTGGESLIKQLRFAYSALVYMIIWRNLIVFFHHLVIVVLIYLFFPGPASFLKVLLLIPGLVIVALNAGWIIIIMGMISARYRDIPPLVGSIIQAMLFVTPIFWSPAQLGESGQWIAQINYLYHLIDLIRAPLQGLSPALLTYAVTIVGAIVGWAVTIDLYARFRRRVAYWL